MTSDEFREMVRDRMQNACHDPMGFDAAVDEIVGQWERDTERSWQKGIDVGREAAN